jgi:hypothetical protein
MDGVSPQRIRNYLHRWTAWWVSTVPGWQYQELLEWFLLCCWDFNPAAFAAGLLHHAIKEHMQLEHPVLTALAFQATA